MQLKKIGLGLFIIIIGAAIGWKLWQKTSTSDRQIIAKVEGPAVILFKADNSASCRAIYKIVDDAELLHGDKINFIKTDWSEDNLLIKKYQIRFLPTVILVGPDNVEVGRIIGESIATQQKLKQALSTVENLSGK